VIGLLLDAGLPRSAAAELRDGGWDVEHVRMEGLDGPRAVEVLRSLLPQVTDELSSGAIVSVDWSGARVRLLPCGDGTPIRR
jgi:hypothetical protein